MVIDQFHWGTRWNEPLGGGWVYLRHGIHCHPTTGQPYRCLDVASVEIPEDERDKGVFTAFLLDLEAQVSPAHEIQSIYIENVGNERLKAFFELRRGYKRMPESSLVRPCFMYLP